MDAKDIIANALQPFQDAMRLRAEIVEPGDSYWYHRPARNFPPKSVQDPGEYDGGERLSLAVTQTSLPAAKQRALVKEWCTLLPTLANVRTLWFQSKVTQDLFEATCAMPGLEGLYIKWSSIGTLAPMAGLRNLSHFHLGGAPSATGLDVLATLPRLIDLELRNVAAAGDLSFLRDMTNLRALMLAGDTNSSKALKVASLAPLAGLQRLERLKLYGVQLEDGSLQPLADLPALQYLDLSNQFAMEEVARLAGRRPDLASTSFDPVTGPTTAFACRKCRQHAVYQLTGKGKPWLCNLCDADRIEKHVAAFNAIVQSQRAAG